MIIVIYKKQYKRKKKIIIIIKFEYCVWFSYLIIKVSKFNKIELQFLPGHIIGPIAYIQILNCTTNSESYSLEKKQNRVNINHQFEI